MFTAIDGTHVTWPGGSREHVDTIVLAATLRGVGRDTRYVVKHLLRG